MYMNPPRYQAADLLDFAERLFAAAGLAPGHAELVARYLVEADLMGHDTHGLALAAWYLGHIADGTVAREGTPETISDKGAAVAWAGRRLPGAYLASAAVDLAVERAATYGTCTVTVGNAHHIGALAAYLHRATDHGMLVSIASSSPSGQQVAPFGGLKGVFTPNPVAHGIPAPQGPVLIDISASITTFNMAQRLIREGRMYPADWVMDADGAPSRDPADLTRGGSLLPTGGLDHGQKGYGMALMVEARRRAWPALAAPMRQRAPIRPSPCRYGTLKPLAEPRRSCARLAGWPLPATPAPPVTPAARSACRARQLWPARPAR